MSGKEIMETGSGISRRGIYVTLTVVAALIAVFGYLSFEWLFCRFYVPPGLYGGGHRQIGAGTPRVGSILVEEGEKGIRREVLAEGRHFLNPIQYDVEIVPAVSIPLGNGRHRDRQSRPRTASGRDHRPRPRKQGRMARCARPRPLPAESRRGYQIEIADAVNIPVGYVGVVTSQTGRNRRRETSPSG